MPAPVRRTSIAARSAPSSSSAARCAGEIVARRSDPHELLELRPELIDDHHARIGDQRDQRGRGVR
jgi:hypothetical protein